MQTPQLRAPVPQIFTLKLLCALGTVLADSSPLTWLPLYHLVLGSHLISLWLQLGFPEADQPPDRGFSVSCPCVGWSQEAHQERGGAGAFPLGQLGQSPDHYFPSPMHHRPRESSQMGGLDAHDGRSTSVFSHSFLDISSLIEGIPQMFVEGKKEEMKRRWEGGGRQGRSGEPKEEQRQI